MSAPKHPTSRKTHQQVAQLAIKQYDLDLLKHRFYAQEDNILYLLYGPEKKHILKLHEQGEDSPDYQTGLPWLEHLSETLKHVLKPLKNRSGQPFTPIQTADKREYIAVVYPWVSGKLLSRQLNLETAKHWGMLLAQIHQRSASYAAPTQNQLLTWNRVYYWETKILDTLALSAFFPAKRREIFQAMESAVTQGLNRLFNTPQNPIIIHGDLHPHNVKVHQKQVYALDFDDCMWGYPVQDIAIALLYIRYRENFSALKAAFQQGYTRVLPWPETAPRQIRLFMMGRLLWMANAVAHDMDSKTEFEKRLKNYEEEFQAFLKG